MIGAEQTLSSARTGRGRDHWGTPPKVVTLLRSFAPIGLDVGTSPDNPLGAEVFFTEAIDGISQPWLILVDGRPVLVFCNPPYSQSKLWLEKAEQEAAQGAEIIMLIASRTGAKYFQGPVFGADAVYWPTHILGRRYG